MLNKTCTSLIIAAAAIVSVPSSAAPHQAYAGASLTIAHGTDITDKVNRASGALAAYGVSLGGTYEVTRPGVAAFLGVNANRYFSGEAGLMFLGRFQADISASGPGGSASGSAYDDIFALYGAGVGRIPITPIFSIFAKGGIAETWDRETCSIANCDTTGRRISPLFGGGVRVNAGHSISFRLEADGLLSVGDSNQYTSGDFTIVQLSALYNF